MAELSTEIDELTGRAAAAEDQYLAEVDEKLEALKERDAFILRVSELSTEIDELARCMAEKEEERDAAIVIAEGYEKERETLHGLRASLFEMGKAVNQLTENRKALSGRLADIKSAGRASVPVSADPAA